MLKRLELIGFKSFADRARFDFAHGITAVVGPNGSGKSNIVDAVRWVLGEQSARTLRGGEMADVIFNGSSTRKSLGMAEATITFDNTRRMLSLDVDEVQITRRVYRDGTGEYLINGNDSRLRDVKEIMLGSGAGANGYTIIAQGRVDELLAASTQDRREIFEEAAGISRFKAKKNETLRKLAGVDQNLVRSQDRLEGLEQQLRTLRLQASKAQRYKEHSDRLRDLRVSLGQREYRELTSRIESEDAALRQRQAEVSAATERTRELEKQIREHDRIASATEQEHRGLEAELAAMRQQIAEHESTLRHERTAMADHEAEWLRVGKLRADLGYRVQTLEADMARTVAEDASAEDRWQTAAQAADLVARGLEDVTERLAALEREANGERERQFEVVSRAATLHSQADSQAQQLDRIRKEHTRKKSEADQTAARRSALEHAVEALSRAGATLQQRLGTARDQAAGIDQRRQELRTAAEQLQAALSGLQVQRSDFTARIDVLEDLDRSLDGLDIGVREVLSRLSDETQVERTTALLTEVVGLVADLFTVPRETAPLIDLALGDAAQHFVIRDASKLDELLAMLDPLTGRVGFVPLRESETRSPQGFSRSLPGFTDAPPPVFSPTADSYVHCEHADLTGLPRQLLGDVVVAKDLASARRLQASARQAGMRLRFITLSGELLEPDGSLTVGPLRAGAGIVSRKSELRDLRRQLIDLDSHVRVVESDLIAVRNRVQELDAGYQTIEAEITTLAGEAGDLQQQHARQQQQLEVLSESIALLEHECGMLARDLERGETLLEKTREAASAADREATSLKNRLEANAHATRAAQDEQARSQQAHTDAQLAVERATAERDRIRERLKSLEIEARKRRIETIDLSAAERNARGRWQSSLMAILRATSGTADAFHAKETLEQQIARLANRRSVDRELRDRSAAELHELRTAWQERQAAAHSRELSLHDMTARLESLVQRLRDDYAIEIAQLAKEPTGDAPDTLLAQQEIDDLKKKLARLGSVNMEALEELTRVETEVKDLRAQHEDLASAQRSLREIIDQINTDSRKLFLETLTAVRGYFQELFRKLFGGGQADIVIENEADVLESGIEITARPPGKELRSISLLSGGEKTLTAIALLLAIFRNKPSPFCLLDEVDAALDEANTQRLASMLKEFQQHSQFVVITHKKRTMAVADVLHGITMQESGVSKQAAVRFEDWPEEDSQDEPAGQAA